MDIISILLDILTHISRHHFSGEIMSRTVSDYAMDGILKIKACLYWFNHRPKACLILLVFLVLYVPWIHFGHSYGSSFKHFLKDSLLVKMINSIDINNALIGWTLLIIPFLVLVLLFKKVATLENKT